jgi:hypothetical protein
VEYLSLDERSKQLVGVLLQLGHEDLLGSLDGISLYRLMNVDFESLLSCTTLDCGEALSLCTEGGGLDLFETCVSVTFLYGESWCLDFQNLVTCLTRAGQGLTAALQDILTHKHGMCYEWGRAALRLEAEVAAIYVPRPDIWNVDISSNDNTDHKVSN